MAVSKKISELPSVGSILAADQFVIARSGANYTITGQEIIDLIGTEVASIESDVTTLQTDVTNIENTYIKKDGSVSYTGDVVLGGNKITDLGDPSVSTDAVNINYLSNNYLALAGGTMTGFITLNSDPTNALHAATKQYVDTQIATLGTVPVDTNDLPEGTDGSASGNGTETDGNRYYYTNQRFDDRLATKTSDDLNEGVVNLYLTTARFNTYFSAKDTDDLSEGTTNLYYTDTRARGAISVDVSSALTYNSTTGVIGLDTGSLPGTALGATTQIPYMNGTNDDFLYSANLTFDGTTLQVGGNDVITGSGTLNTVAKFTPNGISIGDSLIEDDGTSIGVGISPQSDALFEIYSNTAAGNTYTLKVGNNATETASINAGFQASANGSVSGHSSYNVGGIFKGLGSDNENYGIRSESAPGAPTTATNVGGYFRANNGAANHSVQLVDGTEASGRFLKSVDADGRANWAELSESDITDLGTYALVGTYTDGYIPRWNATSNTLESGIIQDNGSGSVSIGTAPVGVTRFIVAADNTFPNGIVGTSTASTGDTKVFQASAVTSNTGDNIGMAINVTNAGSGNAYTLQLQDGLEGSGKVLTSDVDGNATWQDPTTVSGTADRLLRFTSGSYTDSIIIDDGSKIGVSNLESVTKFYGFLETSDTGLVNAVYGHNTSTDNSIVHIGVKGRAAGVTSGHTQVNIAGDFEALGSDNENIAVKAQAVNSTAGDNIGLYVNVANAGAGNAYGIRIVDGTEAAGYVLSSDANGNGSWSALSALVDTVFTGGVSTQDSLVDLDGYKLSINTKQGANSYVEVIHNSQANGFQWYQEGTGIGYLNNIPANLYIGTGGTDRLRFVGSNIIDFPLDKVVVGSFTDSNGTFSVINDGSANSLFVEGKSLLRGLGNTSATTGLEIENIDGDTLLFMKDDGTFAIGNGASNTALNSVVIGTNSSSISLGTDVVIGAGASVTVSGNTGVAVAIGASSTVSGRTGTAVGHSSSAGNAGTSFGYGADSNSTGGTSVGASIDNNGVYSIALGNNLEVTANSDYSVTLVPRYGYNDGDNSVLIGHNKKNYYDDTVSIGAGNYDKGGDIFAYENGIRVFGNQRSPKPNVHFSSDNQGVHHYYPTLNTTLTQNNIKHYVEYNETAVCSSTASATASKDTEYSLDFGVNSVDVSVGDVLHIQGGSSAYQSIAVVTEISGSIVTLDKRLPNNNSFGNVYDINATTLADATIIKVSRFDFVNDGNFKTKGQIWSEQGSTITVTANAATFDGDIANGQPLDLASATGDITLTFTNLKAGGVYFIKVIQKASSPVNIGTYTIAGGTVTFPSGTAPTISTGANAVDTLACYYDGTDVLINYAQDYS